MSATINPPPHWFGMPRPEGHPGPCWGARAIYRTDGPTRTIETLGNRQQMLDGTDAERAKLEAWIDSQAMPYFRARVNREALDSRDPRMFVFQEGGYEMVVSTKASAGYLYMGAWALRVLKGGKDDPDAAPAGTAIGRAWKCYAKPAAGNGQTCGFWNANGGIRHKSIVCCESCGATKTASDARAPQVHRVTSLASLKRIPVGTKLRLVENGRGPCDLERVVAQVTSVHLVFSGPDIEEKGGKGARSYLDFPRASQIRSEPDGFAIITLHGAVLARYRYED